MKTNVNPCKVITGPNTRWSYANVWEPKAINGGTPQYSVSLIIPKDDTATVAKIKAALEGLVGKIEGLTEMHILTECYPCSAGDIMMDSTFADYGALEAYQKHPLHVAVADGLVRPAMCQRLSFDYEV